jgi:hypothetical protein
MDSTYLHLILNHLPFTGILLTFLFLLYASYKKNNDLIRFLLWIIIFFALAAIPVFITGDPAAENIKKLPGISEELIENHEDAGWITFILSEITGAFALAGLILFKKGKAFAGWFRYVLFMLIILSFATYVRTAWMGGKIKHSEITVNNM